MSHVAITSTTIDPFVHPSIRCCILELPASPFTPLNTPIYQQRSVVSAYTSCTIYGPSVIYKLLSIQYTYICLYVLSIYVTYIQWDYNRWEGHIAEDVQRVHHTIEHILRASASHSIQSDRPQNNYLFHLFIALNKNQTKKNIKQLTIKIKQTKSHCCRNIVFFRIIRVLN